MSIQLNVRVPEAAVREIDRTVRIGMDKGEGERK
jgi:hypothetical protein